MTDEQYFRSAVSGRSVIVADERDSVWAYLTEPGSVRPQRDCWLFNKPTAAATPDLNVYRAESLPPPAPASEIDAAGVLDTSRPVRWNVRWSADGEAALIVVDDEAVGVVAAREPSGISRHLISAGPWGRPWDAQLVARLGLNVRSHLS